MTPFEFIFALISIITSLALTHVIGGVVALLRHSSMTRFSARHALWTWVAFTLVIGNWAAFWRYHEVTNWPFSMIAIQLAFMISLYAFCGLVMPQAGHSEKVDLSAFHDTESKRYIGAHICFGVVAIINIAVDTDSVSAWLRGSMFAGAAIVLSVIALVARPVWMQLLAASAIAALGAYFMVSMTNIMP